MTVEYDEKASREIERIYLAPDVVRQRMRTLDALAPRAREAVLDVGCGPGLLLADIARLVGPYGHALGIDASEDMIALARRRCAGLEAVELKVARAEALPESDASFDSAACTQVLLYVPEVAEALAEMYRILKPGGRAVFIETDWRGTVLNSSDDALTRRILAAWDDAVASPNLPVRLAPMLHAAGFSVTRVEAVPIVNRNQGEASFSTGMLEQFVRQAEESGAIDRAQAEGWRQDLRRLDEEGAYFFCVNRFMFTAIRL